MFGSKKWFRRFTIPGVSSCRSWAISWVSWWRPLSHCSSPSDRSSPRWASWARAACKPEKYFVQFQKNILLKSYLCLVAHVHLNHILLVGTESSNLVQLWFHLLPGWPVQESFTIYHGQIHYRIRHPSTWKQNFLSVEPKHTQLWLVIMLECRQIRAQVMECHIH